MDDLTVAEQVDKALRAAKRETRAGDNLLPFGFTIEGFDVQQMIGSGGQGWIFKAIQRSTGRAVAIKVLLDGRFADSRARRRFEREAETLAILDHPHVVSLLDQGRTSGGAHYIAMPFIEGKTLDAFFDQQTARQTELLSQIAKIARAVHACHLAGVLHRDLKPSNILIDAHGHPHILDFGMARSVSGSMAEITRPGCDVGSLLWASPEQLRGGRQPIGPATDIYSLGVLLFQCLSGGRLPFPVLDSLSDTLHNILEVSPPLPSADPGLNKIVLQALAKRPADRFTTALAFAEAIETKRTPLISPKVFRRFSIGFSIVAVLIAIVVAVSLVPHHNESASQILPSGMSPRPTMTNSIGMTLVQIPAGEFDMGTRSDARFHQANETFHHVIISKPFWMASTETTIAQWQAVMHSPQTAADPKLPIADVTLADVQQFCNDLSRREGRSYRLPTESEWEYAARADSRGPFGFATELSSVGWYESNSNGHAHAVGTLGANGWGLFDMLGNVAEMCSGHIESSAPLHSGDRNTDSFLTRGGCYSDRVDACTVSRRSVAAVVTHAQEVGFRVVLDSR